MLAKMRPLTDSTDAFVKRLAPVLRTDEPINVHEPDLAGVAVVLGRWNKPRILLMKRAERQGDPWSGQVAFPGGRAEAYDRSMRDTATRETREEMGINLDGHSTFLGYMGLFRARTRGMRVVPSVFRADRNLSAEIDAEVVSYRWISLSTFLSERSRSLFMIDKEGMKLTFPAFRVGDYLIWGLTERVISTLIGML